MIYPLFDIVMEHPNRDVEVLSTRTVGHGFHSQIIIIYRGFPWYSHISMAISGT
jgi:hypothetical protein